MRPVMTPLTQASLEVYGTNKRKWEPILLSFVDRNQLPTQLGGTASDDDEFQDV